MQAIFYFLTQGRYLDRCLRLYLHALCIFLLTRYASDTHTKKMFKEKKALSSGLMAAAPYWNPRKVQVAMGPIWCVGGGEVTGKEKLQPQKS